MKRITAALLFLLTIPGLSNAQSKIQKLETDAPWEGIIYGCDDNKGLSKPLLEPVAITGSLHALVERTENKNWLMIDQHSSIKGVAVGLVTKTEYQFKGQYSSRNTYQTENLDLPEPQGIQVLISRGNVNIPGLYRLHYVNRLEFTRDLELKVSVHDLSLRCPTIDFPR